MLGRYIYSWFSDKDKSKIPIIKVNYLITDENFEDLENILLNLHIDNKTCVINCIGLIPQRAILSNQNYKLINGIFLNVLWSICKKFNFYMIQPSTDCVFTGVKGCY